MLPARIPRYGLAFVPFLLLAAVSACDTSPPPTRTGRVERGLALASVALACAVVRPASPWTWLVPLGALVAALPVLPETWRETWRARRRDHWDAPGSAAALALILVVAGGPVTGTPRPEPSAGVVLLGLTLVAVTLTVAARRRRSAGRTPHDHRGGACAAPVTAFLVAALVCATRHVPDRTFDAWTVLPPSGRVLAERIVARRLRVAAHDHEGADPSRILVWDGAPPTSPARSDRLIVRLGSPALERAEALVGWVRQPVDLHESAVFGPDESAGR